MGVLGRTKGGAPTNMESKRLKTGEGPAGNAPVGFELLRRFTGKDRGEGKIARIRLPRTIAPCQKTYVR
jgi:hypothetical protein